MAFPDLVAPYQWNFRPQRPRRPAWFTEWPGGARMAVTLILLHEWESTPTIARPMPKGAHHTFDSLALGGREYGAPDSAFGVSSMSSTGTKSKPRSSRAGWSPSCSRKACAR